MKTAILVFLGGVSCVYASLLSAAGFAPRVTLHVDGYSTTITCGDFEGDGYPDLAVKNNTPFEVTVFFGQGNRTWSAPTDIADPGNLPRALAAGDFNGDGRSDLAFGNLGNIITAFGQSNRTQWGR